MKVVARGLDWLELTWRIPVRQGSIAALAARRREAHMRRIHQNRRPVLVEYAGEAFKVHPRPARGLWEFMLYGRQMIVTVAPPDALGGSAVRAELVPRAIWELGADRAAQLARRVAHEVAAEPATGQTCSEDELHAGESLTRVDLAVDHQQGPQWTGSDAEAVCFVAHAPPARNYQMTLREDEDEPLTVERRDATRRVYYGIPGEVYTGATWGGGKQMVRLYNKSREVEAVGHKLKWVAGNWEGADPNEDVWRLEVQVRRERLKELGVAGWDRRDVPRLWGYTFGVDDGGQRAWISHREPDGRTRRRRWPVSPWWREVQAVSWFGQEPARGLRDLTSKASEEQLRQQERGVMLSRLANLDPDTPAAAKLRIALELVHEMKDADIDRELLWRWETNGAPTDDKDRARQLLERVKKSERPWLYQ